MHLTGLVLAALAVVCQSAIAAPAFQMKSLKEIREAGVVMQQWDNSCAAAALATVLTHGYQDPVTERYVATSMLEKTEPGKVKKRGGFSLLDMKRFVEARGYTGDAYQHLSIEDLKLFRAPIVPVHTHGASHYVVFNGMDGEAVLLADPAFGNRRVPAARFKEMWSRGLAFVVAPKRGAP